MLDEMSKKRKGINAERDLIHLFWRKGLAATRVAGSGSSKYPSPDIIAGNKEKKFAIECKVTKEDRKYFSVEEIESLKEFSNLFVAEALIAVKFRNSNWFFVSLDKLKRSGKCYLIDRKNCEKEGLTTDLFFK
jgi:Holliday junction resolvase